MSNSIFETDWWLDAVAPERWRRLEVRHGEELVATLPVVHKRKYGLDAVAMPPFTKFLGPWLAPPEPDTKVSNQIAWRKRLLDELIDRIPRCAYFAQNLHPSLTDWQPFHWRGYTATVRYTYRLDDIGDEEEMWSNLRQNTRTQIRKAERSLEVVSSDEASDFLDVQERAFQGLGRSLPYRRADVERLFRAVRERRAGRILLARDDRGRAHAGILYAWDDRCTHYVIGGADHELRGSGAHSLLIWHAMRHAATLNARFDFEGSMIQAVERHLRGFGGRLIPYFRVVRRGRVMRVARALELILGR